jgi:hypothetical protein
MVVQEWLAVVVQCFVDSVNSIFDIYLASFHAVLTIHQVSLSALYLLALLDHTRHLGYVGYSVKLVAVFQEYVETINYALCITISIGQS